MSLAVRVVRTFGAEQQLVRVVDFPIAPEPGMAVTLPDGAEAVVASVHVQLHDWAPGVYPAAVEVRTIPESAELAEAARAAGWAVPPLSSPLVARER